jgi:glutathione synthase/RimK-type ligase-like ATP-grasp enzyme
LNAPDLISWNIDKSYLLELAGKRIDIVPSLISDDFDEIMASDLWRREIVIKPSISAGARNTGLFSSDDKRARDLAKTIISSGKKVILQPEVSSVKAFGENAIFFFDGQFSHSVNKKITRARSGGFTPETYKESLTPAKVSQAEIELAQRTLLAIKEIATERKMSEDAKSPLYARFDIVAGESGPLLLEAELFEPSYFFNFAPGAVERFADALLRKL